MLQNYRTLLYLSGILLLGLYLSIYTVPEGQRALVFHGEKVLTDIAGKPLIFGSGLHFKLPFQRQVIQWDARLLYFRNRSLELVTVDQHTLRVDYIVAWCVEDPLRYITGRKHDSSSPAEYFTTFFNQYLPIQFNNKTLKSLYSQDSILETTLKEQLNQKGLRLIGLQLRWIPTNDTYQKITAQMRLDEAKRAAQSLAKATADADKIQVQASLQANKLITDAKSKVSLISRQGEKQMMQLYIKAAEKNPTFVRSYNHLNFYLHALSRSKSLFQNDI